MSLPGQFYVKMLHLDSFKYYRHENIGHNDEVGDVNDVAGGERWYWQRFDTDRCRRKPTNN